MSNGNSPFERYCKLSIQIGKFVLDGKRDAGEIADVLQVILDKKEFHSILLQPRQALVSLIPADGWAAEYQRFYREVFSLTVDFAGVEISAKQSGFGWAMYVPKGMATNQAWAKANERFLCHSYIGDDLDRAVPKNDRTSIEAYAMRFRDRVEADEENKYLSANTLAKRKTQNITLLERIILELWYHWRTGQHLDVNNVTLCAGSRLSDGSVPSADWDGIQFEVGYDGSGLRRDYLRSRSAA